MKLPRNTTPIVIVATAVFVALLAASLYVVHFRFSHDANRGYRTEVMDVIGKNLQISLALPLSIDNRDSIKSIVEDLVALDAIYAIEVRNSDNELISSALDEATPEDGAAIPLTHKTYKITPPQIELSDFDSTSPADVGSVRVSFSAYTSASQLETSLTTHAGIILVLLGVFIAGIATYLRTQHVFLGQLTAYLEAIRNRTPYTPSRQALDDFQTIMDRAASLDATLTNSESEKLSIASAQTRMLDHMIGTADHLQSLSAMLSMARDASKGGNASMATESIDIALANARNIEQQISAIKRYKDVLASTPETPALTYLETITDEINDAFARRSTTVNFVVAVQSDAPSSFTGQLTCLPKALKMTLTELIDNAFRFTRSGSVTLDVSFPFAEGSNALVFRINDTGPGLPTHDQAGLLEPFAAQGTGAGVGLGLAVVQHLITKMGGNLDFTSTPKGTTVTLRVPVTLRHQSLDRVDLGKAVVVDDNPIAARHLVSALTGSPKVYPSLAALTSDSTLIADVIILDGLIPGESLLQNIKTLRELMPLTPVVVTTTTPSDLSAQFAIEQIEAYTLAKPPSARDLEDLRTTISQTRAALAGILGRAT